MANFIGMVYGTLKAKGIDTSGMSVDEAIEKFNELNKNDGVDKENVSNADSKNTEQENVETLRNNDVNENKQQSDNKGKVDFGSGEGLHEKVKPTYTETSSKSIKQAIKDAGVDTKNISVRKSRGGYSDAYYIDVKSPYIDIDKVKDATLGFQSYERDYATGEILAGGNTFVFQQYDYGVFDEVAKDYFGQAEQYMKGSNDTVSKYGKGYGFEIQDNAHLFKDEYNDNVYELSVKKEDGTMQRRNIYRKEDLAKYLFQLKQFNKLV